MCSKALRNLTMKGQTGCRIEWNLIDSINNVVLSILC